MLHEIYFFEKLNFNFLAFQDGKSVFVVLAPSTVILGLRHLIRTSFLLIVEPKISSLSQSGPRLLELYRAKMTIFFEFSIENALQEAENYWHFYLYLHSLQVRLISVKSEAVGLKISLLCFHSLPLKLH
jgi:hypothetical protein